MVIFFGLTNSLATFQAMMNALLRDLVVEEKIVVFIDDVMIATEKKVFTKMDLQWGYNNVRIKEGDE